MSTPTEIAELQQLVAEKDELLKVLTERLELAAEQLDRLRRQGGALEPTLPGSSASPADDELQDELRQMLADWRALQDRGWFGQLDERLEFIQHQVANLDEVSFEKHNEPTVPVDEHKTNSVADILARYAAQREETSPSNPEPQSSSGSEPADGASLESPHATPSKLELPEAPTAIDIEHASTEELRTALRMREDYIIRLRDYLQAYDELQNTFVVDVDVESLTPEQKQVMEAWEAKVRKELRQTQIQLWVERAQLSREQMQIQQQQHAMETEAKRLGLTKQKGGFVKAGRAGDDQKSKNWLGLFGNNK